MNSLSSIDISRNPRLENVYLASQSGGNFSGINISQNT